MEEVQAPDDTVIVISIIIFRNMRNGWTKPGKGESNRANGQESSLLRYDNTHSILEEEGEYNLTDRSNSNIPELPISSSI